MRVASLAPSALSLILAVAACGGTGGNDTPAAGAGGSGTSGKGGGASGTAGGGAAGSPAGQAGKAGGAAGTSAGQAGATGGQAGQAGATAGQAGKSGAGQAGKAGASGQSGAAGQANGGQGGGAGAGQAGSGPTPEVCDGIDNDQNGKTDEGCDDDKDGFCDKAMTVSNNVACPMGPGDCDDQNAKIHPGSTDFTEGVDSDCDGKKEYKAKLIVTVDDVATQLCVNGADLTLGASSGNWTQTDTYEFKMVSGPNAVGISGKDTGMVITAMAAYLEVAGQKFPTRGVPGGKTYTASDPEWSQTPWRYFPKLVQSDKGDWCSAFFNDSTWGPAMRAGYNDVSLVGDAQPWGCGADLCTAFPAAPDRPDWVWDPYPVDLQSAWIRIKVTLP